MEFNGTFTLEDVTAEEVWVALSDPVMIKQSLPGCQFLVAVDDDDPDFDALAEAATDEDPPILPEADIDDVADRAFVEGKQYAALMQLSVGSVKPSFETVVTIDRREFPEMDASGSGSSGNSSFEMDSGMTLVENGDDVNVEWWAETDIFGRIAQMGQRVIDPVANRVINRFFGKIEAQLTEVSGSEGFRDRIKGMF